MSTSGSYDFQLTAQGIINASAENLGAMPIGGTPSTNFTTSALSALNTITKALNADGIRIWTIQWVTETFSAPSEVTGTDGEVYTCIYPHESATSNKPITGANYSTFWYQTGSTGGVWATGTDYTCTGIFSLDSRIINILRASIREQDTDSPLEIMGFDKYFDISDKWNSGKPTKLAQDKKFNYAYLYPQPDFTDYANYVLHMLAEIKLEDFDVVGDDPDFISIYTDYIVKALTNIMAPKCNKSVQEQATWQARETRAMALLKRKDTAIETLTMTPAFTVRRRR